MSASSKGRAGETLISKALRSIESPSFLLDDVTFIDAKNGMSHQIDHILIHPHGVFVFESKNYSGTITVNENGRWTQTYRRVTRPIFNPLYQNKTHARMVNKLLEKHYEVIPVVVYVQNNAPYVADDNVINREDIALFVDSYPYQSLITPPQMQAICEVLKSNNAKTSKKEHVENIAYLKQYRKSSQQEMAYAMEQGHCPWCEEKIIIEGESYRCSHCNFHFHL